MEILLGLVQASHIASSEPPPTAAKKAAERQGEEQREKQQMATGDREDRDRQQQSEDGQPHRASRPVSYAPAPGLMAWAF